MLPTSNCQMNICTTAGFWGASRVDDDMKRDEQPTTTTKRENTKLGK